MPKQIPQWLTDTLLSGPESFRRTPLRPLRKRRCRIEADYRLPGGSKLRIELGAAKGDISVNLRGVA